MNRKHIFLLLTLFLITISFSSCATLLSQKQEVTVISDVNGAKVWKGKKFVGTTPLKFKTKSAKSTFTVSKEGYMPQTINTNVAIRWNTLWNWLNCWTGWFIDIATGSTQKYTITSYFVSLKNPEMNNVYNNQHQRQYNTIEPEKVVNILANATVQGIAAGQQRQAEINQEKAIRAQQQKAENEKLIAKSKENAAQRNAILKNNKPNNQYNSNIISNAQGGYKDLLTSDPAWNTQVQMWVQQYGVEKTREIIKKQRENDYQQSIQANKNDTNTHENNEKIISAVTSSRRQVKIKLRGNVIIAYSNSLDQTGKQKWTPVVPNANISKTGIGTPYNSNNLSKEFSYTSNVGNTQIFFDM